MKTLVIHPIDPTTDFLCDSYRGMDFTIFRKVPGRRALRESIREHQRIVMLGHGTQKGLLANERLVIDSKWVSELRGKLCIGIWCYAKVFFNKYDLHGFATGMVVSDFQEAIDYSVKASLDEINESNRLLSQAIHHILLKENDCELLYEFLRVYSQDTNPVVTFNTSEVVL